MRTTVQKLKILDYVNHHCGHITAADVYEAICQDIPHVSRATVYRNLNNLAADGKIRRIEVLGGADVYERHSPPHYHVRCVRCGRLFDLDMPYFEQLQAQIRDPHGFIFLGHDVIFSGICPECQAKETKQAAPPLP